LSAKCCFLCSRLIRQDLDFDQLYMFHGQSYHKDCFRQFFLSFLQGKFMGVIDIEAENAELDSWSEFVEFVLRLPKLVEPDNLDSDLSEILRELEKDFQKKKRQIAA